MLRAASGHATLPGYLLTVTVNGLRWRICATLEHTGNDWRSRAENDSLAAVVFGWLELS